MYALTSLIKLVWVINAAAVLALLLVLLIRRSYRAYPFFCSYLAIVLLQNAVLAAIYEQWGYASPDYRRAAWGTQAIVLAARALAVAELCRHFLGAFRGIWSLARPVLLSCGMIVAALYGLITGLEDWRLTPLSVEMALELAIAVVLVALLVFARYYHVGREPVHRLLAAGLCFYSCFVVINDTIFERWLQRHESLWVILGMSAFTVTVGVWFCAFLCRNPARSGWRQSSHLDEGVYQFLSPRINSRLRLLNDHLTKLGQVGAPHS